MYDQVTRRSGNRIWIERACFLIVIAALATWAGLGRLSGTPCTIQVEGKPVATLDTLAGAKAVLDEVRARRIEGIPPGAVRFAQRVSIRRASPRAEFLAVPEAVKALEGVVTVEAEAFAVTINDVPVVALARERDARKTLDLVKRHYSQEERKLYTEATFKENVLVERRYVEVDKIYPTPDAAAAFLTTASGEPIYHTVRSGDRAVNLALQYDVSLGEIKKLNPTFDLDRLVEGDKLLLRKARPPVTVIAKTLVTTTSTVSVPPGAGRHARGETGRRRTRSLVTYENGEEVSREILSQVTVWQGSEQAPAAGFGRP